MVLHENVSTRKIKLQRNARNHGNLTKATCELHERAINSKKRSHCHGPFVLEKHKGKALIYVEDLRQEWASYNGPQARSGLLRKFIRPAAPVKIAVTEWPAWCYYTLSICLPCTSCIAYV